MGAELNAGTELSMIANRTTGFLMNRITKEVSLLLVEDDDVDATSVERSFLKQRIGNSVLRAHDGLEAYEMLRQKKILKPFIILLDLQMPRMTGLEFLSVIRKDPEFTDSIIFVLTTSKADEDLVASYNHQVAGYFVKQEAGKNFIDVVTMLDSYWKIIHFPECAEKNASSLNTDLK
ncbi:response regulator [Kiloniella laminariae]|uniref:Response regulator n=1 Tax=Kiloniella laminariae TaxID=454162 RepID=A0ABT4LF27_9PROT|nr:response regulator [Kiloniella laminariae]MCZ4279707.1 response regulator [Kiloniella laminariae]